MSRGRVVTAAAALSVSIAACAPRVATPPAGPHRDEPVVVAYAPPVARVEIVPPRPSSEHYWIDGDWIVTGSGYQWRRGRWEKPPEPGAYYAPANLVRRYMRPELYYYPGRWHDRDGKPLGAAPGLAE